ncbi:MAG: hypothetical protein RSE18_00590 [Acinetobacter sp.]
MNSWIPLDNYHQKPKKNQVVILSDGTNILYDMIWIDSFSHNNRKYKEGWYHVDGVDPMDIKPTHWMVLNLPK